MARKDEAADLLMKGNCPSEIARLMGITFASVEQYLYTKIGEGSLRRSDILFSINAELRAAIENVIQTTGKQDSYSVFQGVKRQGLRPSYKDLELYIRLRDARISLGDMYESICQIETTLHEMIKQNLIDTYGGGEGKGGWWREGIRPEIRSECSKRWQEDAEPAAEAFCYTTLIHLRKILSDRWEIFSTVLPPLIAKNKKRFLSGLDRLNTIRNYVMHPVKGMPITEEDFAFVRAFDRAIRKEKWSRR